jgi:nucleoside-diphosphate-sugar epimerase
MKNVLLIGGAGYVGSELSNLLLSEGFKVTVYDLFIYGDTLTQNDNLEIIKGDIRNLIFLEKKIKNFENVIHLACISNDPSFDLNPNLGKSINYDPFEDLVKICKDNGVKKFIYASSSSVYGIKSDLNVDENFSLQPLTDYSKFKAMCEEILFKYNDKNFICSSIRPATVCGYSKRQRLDLVVNILTNNAFNKGEISIFGGNQLRPNINIKDMCNAYLHILNANEDLINGEAFNVGFENHSVEYLAELVKESVGKEVKIKKIASNDDRSYHISSKKISKILGFKPVYSIKDAIIDLKYAFSKNLFTNPLSNEMYYNIKRMNSINLEKIQ